MENDRTSPGDRDQLFEYMLSIAAKRWPDAGADQWCAAASLVWYLMTGEPTTFGGPSIRELAANRFWHEIAGTRERDEAIALALQETGPIFCSIVGGPHEELFLQVLFGSGADSFDNSEEDIADLHTLVLNTAREWKVPVEVDSPEPGPDRAHFTEREAIIQKLLENLEKIGIREAAAEALDASEFGGSRNGFQYPIGGGPICNN